MLSSCMENIMKTNNFAILILLKYMIFIKKSELKRNFYYYKLL